MLLWAGLVCTHLSEYPLEARLNPLFKSNRVVVTENENHQWATRLLLLLQEEVNVASVQTEIGNWPLHGERMRLFIAC